MKNIFHLALIVAPLAALVFFFSLLGRQEVKVQQGVERAVQKIDAEKFDQDFDAWNGTPSKEKQKAQQQRMAELKKDLNKAQTKQNELDSMFEDDTQQMREAINEEGDRIQKNGGGHVQQR